MRLIDADNLRKRHCEGCTGLKNKTCSYNDNVCATMDLVDEEPTVDPVKHGHWKDHKNDESTAYEYYCSLCGYGYDEYDFDFQNQPYYCPMCGAKMDEVSE